MNRMSQNWKEFGKGNRYEQLNSFMSWIQSDGKRNM